MEFLAPFLLLLSVDDEKERYHCASAKLQLIEPKLFGRVNSPKTVIAFIFAELLSNS